jgi:hypothetical protein
MFQAAQELPDRQSERGSALVHLEGEKAWTCMPGTAARTARHIHIGVAGEARMDAALHADFGRAALPGLRARGNLVQ